MDAVIYYAQRYTRFQANTPTQFFANLGVKTDFSEREYIELKFPLKNPNIKGLEAKFVVHCICGEEGEEVFDLDFRLVGIDDTAELGAYADYKSPVNKAYQIYQKMQKGNYKLELKLEENRNNEKELKIKSLSIAGKEVTG